MDTWMSRLAFCLSVGVVLTTAACDDDQPSKMAVERSDEHDDDHDESSDHDGHIACDEPYPVDPRDSTMTGELTRITTNDKGTPDDSSDDEYDLLLPQEMLDWLTEQNWIQEHGDWHNIRRWDMGCARVESGQTCGASESLAARGLSRAAIQEGEPGDGFDFLVMHRHMLRGFRQAFPKHVETLRAFSYVPTSKDDPENPIPWVQIRWSDAQLSSIDVVESIDQHLDEFSSEDDYAKWVQFGDGFVFGGGVPQGGFPDGLPAGFPGFDGGVPPGFTGSGQSMPPMAEQAAEGMADSENPKRAAGGLHGALHSQWAVARSPSGLVDNNKNVQNFAFWKLHGWIDDMWERYRNAAGLREDDPDYQQALIDQCEEMHRLGEALPPDPNDPGFMFPGAGLPTETGAFATEVAPILDGHCSGSVCHGASSPTLGLTLSGAQPSVVREGLVDKASFEMPDMSIIKSGKPEESWLYRKISGNFEGLDCSTAMCTTMPPAGMRLSESQLEAIRSWIAAGATGD